MKVLGIQILSNEAILVVLEKNEDGNVNQTKECAKFEIKDSEDSRQVRQFRDQINAAFDTIRPDKIGLVARNGKAKGRMAPSPVSFKLEGLIQLYDRIEVEFVWPQTISAFAKKNPIALTADKKYQQDALEVAFMLLNR